VAWSRRNIFREIRTQGNFGPWEDCDYIWIYWHISSELLGMSVLNKGAGGAAGDLGKNRR
jgi:hypothetical protein